MEQPASPDQAFKTATLWKREADALRQILLEGDLTEEIKWGKPCYTNGGQNICIIQRMKGFLALLFFRGALLDDPDGVLEAQGPNSRQGYRMRFDSVQGVMQASKQIKAYVRQAIIVAKAGLQLERAPDPDYPAELVNAFRRDPTLKAAFEQLTPGRKRGYVLHITAAKQSKTRLARIKKYRDHILNGKGYQERS